MRKQKERDAKLAEIDLFQSSSQQDQVAAARYLSGKRAIFNDLTDKVRYFQNEEKTSNLTTDFHSIAR